jgi:hypothetical protein
MNNENLDKRIFTDCECRSNEHVVSWDLDIEDDYCDLSFSVFLNDEWYTIIPYWVPLPLAYFMYTLFEIPIRRCWVALKYIFGYKCKYGHFDTFMVKEEDCDKLIELLTEYKEARKKIQK